MADLFKKIFTYTKMLNDHLKTFLDECDKLLECTDRSALSVEERSNLILLQQLQAKIWELNSSLAKLTKPVLVEGILIKNENGRYEVEGLELTSGQYIEYFRDDEFGGHYVPSQIEYHGQDYYIVGLGKEKPIEGLKVRIR